MSQQETLWGSVLLIAVLWAIISAIAATVSVRYEMRRSAWGWTASFV